MSSSNFQYSGFLSDADLRFILYILTIAFFAILVAICSPGRVRDIMRLSSRVLPVATLPISEEGSSDQTRNLLPHRGTDEKSDSSLTKPPK